MRFRSGTAPLFPRSSSSASKTAACLVAASAAALTVGRFTLPVYEIYKVGQDLHWVEGLGLLEHFGFPLVVIPHWNNAEGGTHDTRFCYMGEPRFMELESLLPSDVFTLGLDEHTACLLDLETGEGRVKGIGRVTLRRNGKEILFESGERFSLDVLRGDTQDRRWQEPDRVTPPRLTELRRKPAPFGAKFKLLRRLLKMVWSSVCRGTWWAPCWSLTASSGKGSRIWKILNSSLRHGNVSASWSYAWDPSSKIRRLTKPSALHPWSKHYCGCESASGGRSGGAMRISSAKASTNQASSLRTPPTESAGSPTTAWCDQVILQSVIGNGEPAIDQVMLGRTWKTYASQPAKRCVKSACKVWKISMPYGVITSRHFNGPVLSCCLPG